MTEDTKKGIGCIVALIAWAALGIEYAVRTQQAWDGLLQFGMFTGAVVFAMMLFTALMQ